MIIDSSLCQIALRPVLFVDSAFIECTAGLARRWHKPVRHGDAPLIARDRPWEETPYFTYSNYAVIRDPASGLFKCWYEDLGAVDGKGHPWTNRQLYAESEDGIHFRKPELGICRFDGKGTNIVMGFARGGAATRWNPWAAQGVHSCGIVLDPHAADPGERYRAIFSRVTFLPGGAAQGNSRRTCIAHSADGVHWQPYPDHPVFGNSGGELDDVSCLHYDVGARQFVQNTRHGRMYSAPIPLGSNPWEHRFPSHWFNPYCPDRPDLMNKRRVFQSRSHDFRHWSDLTLVSSPDDEDDNLDEAHYGMQQFRVGHYHFATLGILRFVANEMDVRLLFSHDGQRFQAADRGQPFLAPQGPGRWDAHLASITSPPIEMGDEWWFYHGGANVHHDWWMGPPEGIDEPETRAATRDPRYGLGLARLRREGFASLDGSRQRDGYVVTRPLMSKGTRLVINARCRPGGWIKAAVRGLRNEPLPGRSLEESDAFTGDAVDHTATWGGDASVPGADSWRKIHLELRDAEVFSIRFADADPARSTP